LSTLLEKAKTIYKTDGLMSLLRRGLSWCLFNYQIFYLSENIPDNYKNLYRNDLTPKIDNLNFKIISTNQEADELEANGLEFRSRVPNARKRLEKGAIVACTFAGTEFAAIRWYAMSDKAMKAIIMLPIKVNFDKNEVIVADAMTIPEYRGKGLTTYTHFKTLEFLSNRGMGIVRAAIQRNNLTAMKGNKYTGARVYAEGRYLRILFLKFWREKPLARVLTWTELVDVISNNEPAFTS